MKRMITVIIIGFIIFLVTACNAKYKEEKLLNTMPTEPTESTTPAEPTMPAGPTTPAENTQQGYINIKPEEAKEQLENNDDIILLDVRTKSEYLEEHIPGSTLIPLDELKENAESILTDKGAKIFLYCRSGRRSITAANILLELGYTNVYNLGGIIDWPYEKEGNKYS
jgi:phage shock protein E